MSALAQQLAQILSEARERAGKPRRALADQLGVADTSLIPYERGTANPTLSKAEELARQYGVEIELVVREPGDG